MSREQSAGAATLVDERPQERLRIVEAETPVTPEIVREGAAQALPGDVLALLKPTGCRRCGRTVVNRVQTRRQSPEVRQALRAAGVVISESRGLCCECVDAAKSEGNLEEFPISKREKKEAPPKQGRQPIETKVDVPRIWRDIVENGGSYAQLGERLGVSREYARQVVVRLELPRGIEPKKREREYFVSEVEFLLSCGVGIHQIAVQMGVTEAQLIDRFEKYLERGHTTVRLQYGDITEEGAKAA